MGKDGCVSVDLLHQWLDPSFLALFGSQEVGRPVLSHGRHGRAWSGFTRGRLNVPFG